MLRKLSDSLFNLILDEKLIPHKINIPLNTESLYEIYSHFEEKEIFLAQNINDGIEVDTSYLELICSAVDELLDPDDIDLVHLNEQLEKYFKNE